MALALQKTPYALALLEEMLGDDVADRRSRPLPVRDRSAAERKAYNRETVRKHRERLKAQKAAGSPEPTRDAVSDALADAALMLLAVNGPGADQVRTWLEKAFPGRPGVAMTVTAHARAGKFKPTFITSS